MVSFLVTSFGNEESSLAKSISQYNEGKRTRLFKHRTSRLAQEERVLGTWVKRDSWQHVKRDVITIAFKPNEVGVVLNLPASGGPGGRAQLWESLPEHSWTGWRHDM